MALARPSGAGRAPFFVGPAKRGSGVTEFPIFGGARPAYREEAPFKIHGGCGLMGICDQSGAPMSAEVAVRAMAVQHDRGNGLGGGFAGYGIYPEFPDHYCFQMMYRDEQARRDVEAFFDDAFAVDHAEPIPTRPVRGVRDAPLLWRYFLSPDPDKVEESGAGVDDFIVGAVMFINAMVDGAFVASSGRNMGAFKGVGFPEEIAHFFRLDEYAGHTWVGHNRFPTNTPGWWGGAHPFTLLDWSVVHNGEISSYGINSRYLEQFGYKCVLGTDTEVIAYLFDLLLRRHKLPLELACKALASPLWSEIDRLPEAERALMRTLRTVYGSAMLNGPFAIVVGFSGGLVALNDRIKLRPLVAARQGSILMVASEESALREVLSAPDGVWAPKAGEPVVARIPSMPWPIPGDGHVTVAEPAPPAEAPAAEAALPAADFCVAAL
jgi:glutamate synthase domain-containing protein 1